MIIERLIKDIIKTLHVTEELPLKVTDLDFDNVNYLLDTSSNHLQEELENASIGVF